MQDPIWKSQYPAPLGQGRSGDEAPSYARPSERGAEQLREAISLIRRGKWIVLGVFVVVMSLVVLYNYSVDPEYETYTLVFLSSRQSTGVGEFMGFEGGSFFGSSNSRFLANEIINLRQSQPIAEAVAERLLATASDHEPPLTILYNAEGQLLPRRMVAKRLPRYLQIVPEGVGVDYIRIQARSTLPQEAAMLANYYAEEFERRTQQTSRERLAASRSFLEEQETKLAQELRRLEEEVSDYKSRQGAVALDAEANRTVEQLADLEAQRDQTRIELQMKAASLTSLEDELARIEPRLVERIASRVDQDIKSTQARIAELELERDQVIRANPNLGQSNIAGLQEIESEIARRNAEIDVLSQRYVDEVLAVGGINLSVDGVGLSRIADLNRQVVDERIAISGLRAQEEVLGQRIGNYSRKLKSIPEQAVRLAQLERNQQSTEGMYLFIVEKLNETRVAEESELGYAETIRWADPPSSPVHPKKSQNITIGILLGLLLGIGIALLRYKMDNRIYRPDDLKEKGISLLGVIPDMSSVIKHDFGGQEKVEMEGRRLDTSLLALLMPLSPLVEAYRQVRTNLQFSRPDTVVQTLLVTSSGAGEGKSVTATNLAVVMARAGRKTLLIDADLRRPRVHKVLDLPREPGLVEMLFDEANRDPETLRTEVDNLFVLPAGTPVPNPSELLGSLKMRDLLHHLREAFDVIIIDSPPVLVATDAPLLATQCDGTMMVISAGHTEMHELETAVESLRSVGAVFLGGLLNRFDPAMAGGYTYKYSYYNKYGYSDRENHAYQPTKD